MLRTPVNEVTAGQSAGLIGSEPGDKRGPGQAYLLLKERMLLGQR